jgi:DNA-binding CsgD family transcriptional regulator
MDGDGGNRLAPADSESDRDTARPTDLWLGEALERLPLVIGLIDRAGRYIALSGSMRSLFGDVIPSRNQDLARRWTVFDDDGNPLDPKNWPSERTLRGDPIMKGVDAVYISGSHQQRRVRIFSTPFVDSSRQSAGLVLLQDAEFQHGAHALGGMQQRFVDTLVATIRQASFRSDGDPDLARQVIAHTMGLPQAPSRTDGLSRREEEVLRLMAFGKTRKDISAELGITVKTVEFHRTGATRKLGLTTRVDIVRYAIDRGWLR